MAPKSVLLAPTLIFLALFPAFIYLRVLLDATRLSVASWKSLTGCVGDHRGSAFAQTSVKSIDIVKWESSARPCCVSPTEGEIECFAVGPSLRIEHVSIRLSPLRHRSSWEDLSETAWNGLECVTNGQSESYDIVLLNSEQQMMKRSHTTDGWSDWETLGGGGDVFIDRPSCLYTTNERMDCVNRGPNNYAYNQWAINGTWTGSRPAHDSRQLVSPLALVSRKHRHSDCFAIKGGTTNALYYSWNHYDIWNPWYDLGNWWKGRPVVTSNKDRVDIFGIGKNNQIIQKTWTSATNWRPTEDLGGQSISDLECTWRRDPYMVWCFAIGRHSILYRNVYIRGRWTGWRSDCRTIQYAFLEAPSCVFSAQNEVSCYGRNSDTEIVEIIYTTPVIGDTATQTLISID